MGKKTDLARLNKIFETIAGGEALELIDITAIVHCFKAQHDDLDVLIECASAFWNIAAQYTARERQWIVDQGGISIMMQNMHAHAMEATLVARICGAFSVMATKEHRKMLGATPGLIEGILEAMKTHIANANVQSSGCAALCNLAFNDTGNKAAIVKGGGIPVLIHAMNNFGCLQEGEQAAAAANEENEDDSSSGSSDDSAAGGGLAIAANLQEHACATLRNLALNNAENKVLIHEAGGIQALLQAVRVHPHNVNIAENVLGALRNLASTTDQQRAIASADGFVVIFSCMNTFPNDPDVQASACGAIRNLAFHPDNAIQIVSKGGLGVIMDAMELYAMNVKVQKNACDALTKLATNNPAIAQVICKGGGLDAVRTAKACAKGDPALLQSADLALSKLEKIHATMVK